MASKKKLGRGLEDIFGENIDSFLDDISSGNSDIKTTNSELAIDQIRPNPYQPRKNFDQAALQELAQSIKENGVFQPILVRKSIQGYELVAGERRLRASKLADKTTIPAIIVEFDDKQMMEISLLENIQRENLSVLEEAQAYQQLIDKLGYTQEQLATRINKSRSNITNLLRLLNLPSEIKQLLNEEKLTYGHARALLALDDQNKMLEFAHKTIKDGLNVRQLEKLIKDDKKVIVKREKQEDPFIKDVCNNLENKYSTKVEINNNTIKISYNDVEDLNRILELMGVIEDGE